MGLTNLGPMLETDIAAVRRAIAQPTKPARVRKAIVTRTRRNGSRESAGNAAARAKAKGKEKVKQNTGEAETGRVMAQSYLAPTTTKGTATANLATIAASPMMGRKAESASKLHWPSKALRRNKRKQ